MLQLYLASEDDADAIAAGEYVASRGTSLRLPDDVGADDLEIGDLAVLDCLVWGCRVDPEHPVLDEEPIAVEEGGVVYLALPEFLERLSGLADPDDQEVEQRWVVYLNGGEDEEGAWTLEKARRVVRRLAVLARRALDNDLQVLIVFENWQRNGSHRH